MHADRLILSTPRAYPENPYLARLASALAVRGIRTRASSSLTHLVAAPGRARWLHLHWPEWLTRDADRSRARLRAHWLSARLDVARARGMKIAWTAHNLLGHDEPHEDLARDARRALLSRCDVVFGHFASCERDVRALGFRGLFALTAHPHYADDYPPPTDRRAAREDIGLPLNGRVLVSYGSIEPYKGTLELVRAFLCSGNVDDRLLVLGRAPDLRLLEALREIIGADHRVSLRPGFRARNTLVAFLSAADAAIFAYRDFYTSGTAMLAATCGLRVIGPPVHHLATMAAEPWFIPLPTLASLGDALAAIDHTSADGARAWALSHTWEDVARTVDTTLFGGES